MMPYHRRGMAIRPVQRIKHVIDTSAVLALGTVLPITLVAATDTPTIGVTTTVITGSKVNGIYLKVVASSNDATGAGIPNVYLMVYKNPGGNLTMPAPNAVGPSDNKRFVIHQEMVMIDGLDKGVPTTVFNGVIVIPKGYRRMGPNDLIKVDILAPAIDINVCFQCHYKEFR